MCLILLSTYQVSIVCLKGLEAKLKHKVEYAPNTARAAGYLELTKKHRSVVNQLQVNKYIEFYNFLCWHRLLLRSAIRQRLFSTFFDRTTRFNAKNIPEKLFSQNILLPWCHWR